MKNISENEWQAWLHPQNFVLYCRQCVCIKHLSTYSKVMLCVAVHAVLSLWMLFLGVHYSSVVWAWELLSKWGEMGIDENPESVEQWDVGFKSCMAISKDFYSWCHTQYVWGVSSTELENNSKVRFVCGGAEIPPYKPLPGVEKDSESPNECCLFAMFIDSN